MISEGDARELLARAAATIDVDAHAPLTLTGLPDERRRRWPALAAIAASVALVAGLGYGAAQLAGGGATNRAPAAGGEPVERERLFGEREMPSLLGYTEAEAVELLESRGLETRVRPVPDGCNVPDVVVGAEPAVGSALAPGDVVTLRVVRPQEVVDCVGEPDWPGVWDLVRFARDLDDEPPSLADRVDLSVVRAEAGGEVEVAAGERTSAELNDPAAWTVCAEDACHSPLGGLAQMLSDPALWPSPSAVPFVSLTQGYRCHPGGRRAWVEGRWSYHLWVEVPVDGVFCPTTSLLIGRDESGAVDAVELRLPPTPEAGDVTEPELAAGLERIASARAFVGWARGDGPAPDFADRVRHFGPGFSSPWKDEPEVREGWSGCSGLGFPDCGLDPVGTIARYEGRVVPTAGRSTCPAGEDVPAEFADADVVRLSEPEPATCRDAWAVELWITEDGEVYAVRQLGMSP